MHERDNMEHEGTDDKCMIIVPVNLLAKIDLNRDKLSRAEFVELCIDTLTEQGDDEGQDPLETVFPGYRVAQTNRRNNNVTRHEFEDLKASIKDMMRTFVESLPQRATESWTQATSEAEQRSRQLMELLED